MLKSTTFTLCDHTIVTISVGPFSELEDHNKVGWRILTGCIRAMGKKMNTQSSQARRELGRVRLPIASYLCCSGVVVIITPRIDDRPYLNIRQWKRTNHGADHTWPVRVQLRAQRPAHIEPVLGRLRQGRIKTVK